MEYRKRGLWSRLVLLALVIMTNACTYEIYEECDMADRDNWKEATGWSKSGKLVQGNPNSRLTMQKTFPEPEVYTVEFGVDGLQVGAAFPNTIADITWKVAGNQVRRRVTVMTGMGISAPAEAVDIRVSDASLGVGPNYTVTINVSKGPRGANVQPPIFVPVIESAASGTLLGSIIVPPSSVDSFTVPTNIGIISMYTTAGWNDASDPTAIGNSDLVVQQFATAAFRQYFANNEMWVPILPNMMSVRFWNNVAAPAAGAVFGLTFGIEG